MSRRDGYNSRGEYDGKVARDVNRVIQGRPMPQRTAETVQQEIEQIQMRYLEALDPSIYVTPVERSAMSQRICELEAELAELAGGNDVSK